MNKIMIISAVLLWLFIGIAYTPYVYGAFEYSYNPADDSWAITYEGPPEANDFHVSLCRQNMYVVQPYPDGWVSTGRVDGPFNSAVENFAYTGPGGYDNAFAFSVKDNDPAKECAGPLATVTRDGHRIPEPATVISFLFGALGFAVKRFWR